MENSMKKAVVFGVGRAYKQYYELIDSQYDICVLADSDVGKHGQNFNGKLCVSPEKIMDYSPDVVIVTPIAKAIRKDIVKLLNNLSSDIGIVYVEECMPALFSHKCITDKLVYEDGFHNRVICDENVSINELKVEFKGINNLVKIHANVKVDGCIRISCCGNDNLCEIGEGTTIVSANCEISEAGKIIIGKDCMLSWDIDVFQKAFHPIYDMETGERVNKKKDIVIGDHVWIGKGVGVLPGSEIGEGSIIGYGSVTTKKYPAHCTLAGIPAKILRENVCWERDVTGYYPMDKLL